MEYWLWLSELKGIGPILEKRLLAYFKTPKAIYEAEQEELMLIEGVGSNLAKTIRQSRALENALKSLELINKSKIKILTIHDKLYAKCAQKYDLAPVVLYYQGTIREKIDGVTIVGARKCSSYAKQVAVEAATYLAKEDVPVISGMAKGIDSYAHTACVKAGGYTIAFLGHGLDMCYPKEHKALMENIKESGAVISEYPLGVKPQKAYFPRRNALMSSWSQKVLVVEAAEKSGALITAKIAKQQGKEVLVPPHEIYYESARGTNLLISEGATLYLNPSQLMNTEKKRKSSETKDLEKQPKIKKVLNKEFGSPTEYKKIEIEDNMVQIYNKILNCLDSSSMNIEELEKNTSIKQVELIGYLAEMELEGVIEGIAGGKFRRKTAYQG